MSINKTQCPFPGNFVCAAGPGVIAAFNYASPWRTRRLCAIPMIANKEFFKKTLQKTKISYIILA